jgi:hypothetical protein
MPPVCQETRVVGDRQEERERDYHGCGSATGGADEAGEDRHWMPTQTLSRLCRIVIRGTISLANTF